MALKTERTWVVSRHADDLPSFARIMAFYGGERADLPSRALSERESAKGSADIRVGSASVTPSEGSMCDSDAMLMAEIVTVSAFVRRLESIVGQLQAQMAAYDPSMPRTALVPVWREIGERISLGGADAERRRGSGSRPSVSGCLFDLASILSF